MKVSNCITEDIKNDSSKFAIFEFHLNRMRLSKVQIEKIKSIGQGIFGQDAKIYLFGSRTNDEKKGGDIDLIIETNNIQLTTLENKIKYLVNLKLALGDQKIDLVYQNQLIDQPSFKNSLDNTRIRL